MTERRQLGAPMGGGARISCHTVRAHRVVHIVHQLNLYESRVVTLTLCPMQVLSCPSVSEEVICLGCVWRLSHGADGGARQLDAVMHSFLL